MKRSIFLLVAVGVAAITMLAVALYVPSSLPVHLDFSAIYYTDLALVNGVPIYDLPRMEALALEFSGAPPKNFFMPRFPYPPWYAVCTFYLGLLPVHTAGMLWFEINLSMLFVSIWFLTDGWHGRLRLIAFPLGLLFLPVLGVLSVGQYGFPVLLGTALLTYSLRRENVALTTLGAVLLTFKPHIGALMLLSVLICLSGSRNEFGRRALLSIAAAGVFLFASGFIADPAWPLKYPAMLLGYQGEGNVSSCSECASAPVFLSRWFFDGSLLLAVKISVALLLVFASLLFVKRRILLKSPELLLASALLVTLLAVPYLYNYDFALLLLPFALATGGGIVQKIVVALCYLVPTFAIAVYGRAGNIALIVAAVVMALLVARILLSRTIPPHANLTQA